jgi:hypothetical protein
LPEPDFACQQNVDGKIPYVGDARLMAGDQEVAANVPQKVYTTNASGVK